MPGPKPKPTKLKLISGNPGKRALNKSEPNPKAAKTRAPAGLSKMAQKHWRTVAVQLSEANILTELDRPALILYCESWARWQEASKMVQERGMLVKSPTGYPMQNPYLSIANKALDQMQRLLVEFGMTPSSRSRIQIMEDKDLDPFGDFLSGK